MRWSCVLAVFVAACAPGGDRYVPFPPIQDGSFILGVTNGDRPVSLHAVDVSTETDAIRIPEVIEGNQAVGLELLRYDDKLEDLGIDPGPVVRAQPNERTRPLPPAASVHRFELPNGAEWQLVNAMSEEVAAVEIFDPGPQGCVRFAAEAFPIGDDTDADYALKISPTEVVIGMESGHTVRWTPSGLEPVVVAPAIALSHGVRDEVGGGYWFITRFGQLYRGVFSSPTRLSLTYVTQSRTPREVYGRQRIALRYENDEPIIYSNRSDGVFERFDANGATVLHEFGDGDFGAKAILTPTGDIVAAASGSTNVVRVKPDGTMQIEETPSGAGFTAGRYIDEFGLVLGSSSGRFYTDATGTWTEVDRSPLTVFPFALVPYEGGFLYAGAFGAAGQYLPTGYCPLVEQVAAFTIQLIERVEGGILVLGQNPSTADTPGQLVRLLP